MGIHHQRHVHKQGSKSNSLSTFAEKQRSIMGPSLAIAQLAQGLHLSLPSQQTTDPHMG